MIEGQDGDDRLEFHGANVNEHLDLSANGSRVRLTRDVANIVMDLNGVEEVDLPTRGGADVVTVNDLTGTDLVRANVDLEAAPEWRRRRAGRHDRAPRHPGRLTSSRSARTAPSRSTVSSPRCARSTATRRWTPSSSSPSGPTRYTSWARTSRTPSRSCRPPSWEPCGRWSTASRRRSTSPVAGRSWCSGSADPTRSRAATASPRSRPRW